MKSTGVAVKYKPRIVKPSQAVFLQLIRVKAGKVAEIAKALRCTNGSVRRWIKEDPVLSEAWVEMREGLVDYAEDAIFENVQSTNETIKQRAAEFILRYRGAGRGWQERQIIDITQKKVGIKVKWGITDTADEKHDDERLVDNETAYISDSESEVGRME